MDVNQIVAIVSVTIALATFIGGWVKASRNAAAERNREQHEAHVRKLSEHANWIKQVGEDTDKNYDLIQTTRDEMYRDFAQKAQIEKLQEQIRDDFNVAYKKMDDVAASVNRLVGVLDAQMNRKVIGTNHEQSSS